MNLEEVLDKVMRDREQVLVRLGYLEGQADILRMLIQERAKEAKPPATEPPDPPLLPRE